MTAGDPVQPGAGPGVQRLALSSAVWGIVVIVVGIGGLLATSSGVDASKGQESLLQTASGLLTIGVGALFVASGQRLRGAAEDPRRWPSAIGFLTLALQAQIAIVVPAIATTVFFALQGH